MSDYQAVEHAAPDEGDSAKLYASYLAGRGVTAMVVVTRLHEEFGLTVSDAWDVLRRSIGPYGSAMLREVALIDGLRNYPDDHALARKVAKNTGMDTAEAVKLVQAFRASQT